MRRPCSSVLVAWVHAERLPLCLFNGNALNVQEATRLAPADPEAQESGIGFLVSAAISLSLGSKVQWNCHRNRVTFHYKGLFPF
jgi:hypothetical protein